MSGLPQPNADPKRREVYELADAQLSGGATVEQTGRLRELVCNDGEARRHYLRFMHDSATLCRWGRDSAGAAIDENRAANDDLPQPLEAEAPEPLFPAIIIDPGPALRTPLFSFHPFVGSPLFSYAAATVITGMAILGAWVYKVSFDYQLAATEVSSRGLTAPGDRVAQTTELKPESVGRISGMADCRWADPLAIPPRRAAAVPLGQQYALNAGLMEISYDSGAKVLLQGPCTYSVDSPNGGFLSLGKLTARVETKAEGGRRKAEETDDQKSPFPLPPSPFVVRTPTAVVTDLGTEFGVEVDKQDSARVYVFKGAVTIANRKREGKTTVRAGETVQITSGAMRRMGSDEASQGFTRRLRPLAETPLLNDDFMAPLLSPSWKWDNPHPVNTYSLTQRRGWLRILLAGGGEDTWVGGRGDAPLLRTEAAGYPANFSVETVVDAGTANGGTVPLGFVAGLVVYDREHYLPDDSTHTYYPFQFTYGFHRREDGRLRIEAQACGAQTPLLSTAGLAFPSACLRMDRAAAAKTWTLHYRPDAANPWITLGAVNDGQLPGKGPREMELGLSAKTYGLNSKGANADFGYFRVTPAPDKETGSGVRPKKQPL